MVVVVVEEGDLVAVLDPLGATVDELVPVVPTVVDVGRVVVVPGIFNSPLAEPGSRADADVVDGSTALMTRTKAAAAAKATPETKAAVPWAARTDLTATLPPPATMPAP